MQKRHDARTIRGVRDGNGPIQTSSKGNALAFTTHLRNKYNNTDVDDEYARALAEFVRVERPMVSVDIIENQLDPKEIYNAIQSGWRNRAPGRDGLELEFHKSNCEIILDDLCIILNHMLFGGAITPSKNMGQYYACPSHIECLRRLITAQSLS
jgi:hypothetical protein